MVFLRKIDRYLLRHFFQSLLIVVVAFGLTFVVINIVEELRDFIDHEVPLLKILEYYLYFAGWILKSFLPMFILLAVLFSVSILARKNELLAMKASGVSLYRITLPFMVVVLLLAAGHFYYNEYLYPPWNKKRLEIKNFTIERKSKRSFTRLSNIYRQIKPGYFYTINTFNVTRREGQNLKVYKKGDNRLNHIITAKSIVYEDNRWLAKNGTSRTFNDSLRESYYEFDTLTLVDIEEKPEDFAKKIGKPEDMGYDELKSYIDLMKRTGGPHVRESIDLEMKYSYPLASLIVVLICIPYASNPRRGGIAVSIAVGALISLVYFVLFRILQSAGYNEKIPSLVAVWGINALFFVIGIISLLKARK